MRSVSSMRGPWRRSLLLCAVFLLLAGGAWAADPYAARRSANQAESLIRDGSFDEAEAKLQEAEKLLADTPDAQKAPVTAQIKELRDDLAGARKRENARLVRVAKGYIEQAKSAGSDAAVVAARLNEAEKVLQPVPDDQKTEVMAEIRAMRPTGAPAPAPVQAKPAGDERKDATASAADLGAARSRIGEADMLASSAPVDPDSVEAKLKQAETLIAGASDAQKTPLLARIKEIRDKLVASQNAENARIVRSAQGLLVQAKSALATGMPNDAEAKLKEAETLLQPVPDKQKTELLAQIKAMRDQAGPPKSDEARAVERRLTGIMDQAERSNPEYAADDLKRAATILGSDEAKPLDAPTRQALQARLDQLRLKLAGNQKKDILERAAGPIKELDDKLAADPFHGLDQIRAHDVHERLAYLATRAHAALDDQPKGDPDVKAMNDRLAALESKLAAAEAQWSKEQDIAQLTRGWNSAQQSAAGWEQETPERPSGVGLRPWLMTKTATAITSTNYWLGQKDTKQTIDKYRDDPAVKTVRAEAEKTRDAATAKLSDAFNKSLEEAEQRPRPQRGYDLSVPATMAREAEQWFAGTSYKDANAGRAMKLDAKWKAELAAIEKEAAGALKQLTADAEAKWPKIVGRIKTEDGFTPANAAAFKGKTVRFKAVRNRSGWDDDGTYGFLMWVGDTPLAGNYAPNVAAALQETARRVRQDVDDHIDWDVVLVIEGPGKINKRQFTEVIDNRTRDVLAKVESYHPLDCTMVRVIALHAGPVAVGPE